MFTISSFVNGVKAMLQGKATNSFQNNRYITCTINAILCQLSIISCQENIFNTFNSLLPLKIAYYKEVRPLDLTIIGKCLF